MYEALAKAELPAHVRAAAIAGQLRLVEPPATGLLLAQLRSSEAAFFDVGLAAARAMPGAETTGALVRLLDELLPPRQALLLRAIGDRKERPPLSRIVAATHSRWAAVRAAAVDVLVRQAQVQTVSLLIAAAQGHDPAARIAKEGLETMPGKEIDAVIAVRLAGADPAAKLLLLEVAGARGIATALPAVLKACDGGDEPLRLAAIRTLGQIAAPGELPLLLGRLAAATTPREKEAIVEALTTACKRAGDRDAAAAKIVEALPQAPRDQQQLMFPLLAAVGGRRALGAASAFARSVDAEIQDAATRALGVWPTTDAAAELLALATTLQSQKLRIRTLRGYIRIARQMGMPAEQREAMCGEALRAAGRDEERKLVLEILGRGASARSLALVLPYLRSAALKEEAAAAAMDIAQNIVQDQPKAVAAAMPQILQAGLGRNTAGRAKWLLEQATRLDHL